MATCSHPESAPSGNRVVLVSYASGMPGFSPSEWIDSKLSAARALGQHVTVVTSADSELETCQHQSVIRIHSLSLRDFRIEQSNLRKRHKRAGFFSKILATTLGRVFDALFFRIVGSFSDGRWSWVMPSMPIVIYLGLRLKPSVILATGGPSSALFSAALASFVPGVAKPIIELQDPFIGSEMKLSPRVMSGMVFTQRFLLRASKKYVVVSEGSRAKLVAAFPSFRDKVHCIYPYSQPSSDKGRGTDREERGDSVELLHLGTLYGTRNLGSLFEALDFGVQEGVFEAEEFRVVNLGADYTAIERLGDYSALPALGKTDAISRASDSDVLLLVQHSDDRSLETIPFKFYDYLNLDKPILVIGRNKEIKALLSDFDFYADVLDPEEIVRQLAAIKTANRDGVLEVRRSGQDSGRAQFIRSWIQLTSQ